MHLPEGILPLSHAASYAAIAAPFVVWSMIGLRQELTCGPSHRRALLGFAGALLFALTLFPLPLPPLGFSIHLCAAPVLALLIGLRPVIGLTALNLVGHLLLAAHGGFTTLGANILTLGILGPAVTVGLFGLVPKQRRSTLAAAICCALGSFSVYAADVGILALAFSAEAPNEAFATTLVMGLAALIVPLVIAEGALSAALYSAVKRRLDALTLNLEPKKTAAALFVAIALLPSSLAAHSDGHHHDGADHHEGLPGFDHLIFEGAADEAGVTVEQWHLFDSYIAEPLFFLSIFACGALAAWGWCRFTDPPQRRKESP